MKTFVFLGPTLAARDALPLCEATYLPPAGQGDIYRATREQPFAIGLIDGYFERIPAVWHKEILWALKQGVHVLGAASMGALRAAELDRFGMRGVGRVYEAFRSGELSDDDEVAVAHGDASTAFAVTSEAMVNIRATLHAAEEASVVSPEESAELIAAGKSLFYPDRCYPSLFARALERGVSSTTIARLRDFLPRGRVDQKREDAIALLGALAKCCEAGEPAAPATFPFSHSEAWDQVIDWADAQPPLGSSPGSHPNEPVPPNPSQ